VYEVHAALLLLVVVLVCTTELLVLLCNLILGMHDDQGALL
jgi:hypothetical protein